mmetsp:Transcript_12404/g.20587  ORF Transcript_12404/g.20587 Transcript_12404/m.20587 type:complete len:150 (-) Transcript_12404:1632-2081(-)
MQANVRAELRATCTKKTQTNKASNIGTHQTIVKECNKCTKGIREPQTVPQVKHKRPNNCKFGPKKQNTKKRLLAKLSGSNAQNLLPMTGGHKRHPLGVCAAFRKAHKNFHELTWLGKNPKIKNCPPRPLEAISRISGSPRAPNPPEQSV